MKVMDICREVGYSVFRSKGLRKIAFGSEDCLMARYDYKCTSCGTVFEVEHPMSERPEVSCPSCGAHAERVFTTSGIHFEGTGFYNTDRRKTVKVGPSCDDCPHKD